MLKIPGNIVYRLKSTTPSGLLRRYKFVDGWFWARYGLNPYQGCQHACTYCDSRSYRYQFHDDFAETIYIKEGSKGIKIGEVLEKRLARARTLKPDVVVIASACDPYQPAEKKYENTRQCLEVLAKFRFAVHILTKSSLVLRDLELFSRIAKETWCSVSFSITTVDKKVAKFLEPHVPSPEERFAVIQEIKKHNSHIQVGVLFIPIIPFLCDSDENLRAMVEAVKESGADYILFGDMTMRDRQAVWFMRQLEAEYPDLVESYRDLYEVTSYKDEYEGRYEVKPDYKLKINRKMLALCEEYNIPWRIKRYIPDNDRRKTYIVAEHFINEGERLKATGESWANTFWAGQNINNLEEPIEDVARRGELQKIRNVNAEVERTLRQILEKT